MESDSDVDPMVDTKHLIEQSLSAYLKGYGGLRWRDIAQSLHSRIS